MHADYICLSSDSQCSQLLKVIPCKKNKKEKKKNKKSQHQSFIKRSVETQQMHSSLQSQKRRETQKRPDSPPDFQKIQQKIERQSRIQRSKKQKLFLLGVVRHQSERNWSFNILGSMSIPYTVEIGLMLSCTCYDFQKNWKPCKHIFFIVTKIAVTDEVLNRIEGDIELDTQTLQILDGALMKRLQQRLVQPQQQKCIVKGKPEKQECSICYLEMEDHQKLENCPRCSNFFHTQCLRAWKIHKETCPLCRGSLSHRLSREKGVFQKLDYVQLN